MLLLMNQCTRVCTLISGCVNLWKVALLTEGARSVAMEASEWWPATQHVYWWANDLHPNLRTLMLASQYTFTPAFYDTRRHLYNPVCVNVQLAKAGRSSYQLYEETAAKSGQEEVQLHTSSISYVTADTATGRPCDLPASFRDLFTGPERDIGKVPYVTPPNFATVLPYTCQWSHSDMQYHINQSQYIKFALDAAGILGKTGELSHLTGEIGQWKVKRCTSLFLAETLPGQTLNIHIWEDKDNPWILHAHMERKGKAVYQAMLEYYDTQDFSTK